MASSAIHLAVAKKYFQKNNILNYEKFIAGSLYPDASDNKDQTHYTDSNRGNDNISHVRSKVNLYSFLKERKELDDFELGWFLHLVTDYLFFEECFSAQYLLENSYKKFCEDLYFAYNCLSSYISDKYNITKDDYNSYPSEYYPGSEYKDCILTKGMIDEFIERVSSININEYIKLIKITKVNINPN